MKYKLIYYIHKACKNSWKNVFVLSVLIVSACSGNNDLLPIDIDEADTSPVDTAFVSLATDMNSYVITRGYEGQAEAGSSEEDFVETVRIVLYDGEEMNSKVVKCFDFNIRTNSQGGWSDYSSEGKDLASTTRPNDKSQFITYARKVPVMDLKMLVIINISPELKSITEEGCMYQQIAKDGVKIEKNLSKSDKVGGLAKTNYFLMTSGPGLIPIEKEKLKATVREAHNDPVVATVSRVVGKVTVVSSNGEDTFPTEKNAVVRDIQWELDITNRYTYWMIQGQLDENRRDWYWRDPNYSGYGSKPFNELQNDFFYFASTGQPYPIFKNRLKGSEYCLENTMDETDQNSNNVITRVLIRCIYKPVNVQIPGDSFYVYENNTYSINEMKEFAREANILPESLLSGFYKAIKEASEEGYSFLTGKPIKNNSEVSEPFTVKGITYYYKGINYYAVKIRHRGVNDQTTGYAHYGVLRNTHYTVSIDKIEGPGSPGILWDPIATRSINYVDNRLYKHIESSIQIQ